MEAVPGPSLGATGLASNEERDQARIRIDTLARKLKAVHLLLDAERQATEVELANAIEQRGKVEKGTREAAEIDARIFRLEARVKTLQLGR
jgi:DNA-binding transcriptional regulator LsrR (DeoR family)